MIVGLGAGVAVSSLSAGVALAYAPTREIRS